MTVQTKPRPQELFRQIADNPVDAYARAYDNGLSLSAWLEVQDPSTDYNDGLDAFERQLKVSGVRTNSVPVMGAYASTYGEMNDAARALIPEWISRQWRKVQHNSSPSTRNLLTSSEGANGSFEKPYADAQSPRWSQMISPAIPVGELVAMTTPIQGTAYRAYYLTHDETKTRKVRVSEGAEVPRVKLVGAERSLDLLKYGRSLEATYENLRYTRVDKIALWISQLAAQAESDKVAQIIDVIVNGDGNSGTAATNYDINGDFGETVGSLSLSGWLQFKMKFANPYVMTTVLAQESVALEALTLSYGSANIPLVTIADASGFGSFRQINPNLNSAVAIGWDADAPANKFVALDNRFAIERVVEIGADISEVERFTTRQTQVLTMTETEGFAVMDASAIKTLDIST